MNVIIRVVLHSGGMFEGSILHVQAIVHGCYCTVAYVMNEEPFMSISGRVNVGLNCEIFDVCCSSSGFRCAVYLR